MIYHTLVVILAALQVADVITTNAAIRNGAAEGNPVIAAFMRWFGDLWWIGKALLALAVLVPLWFVGPQMATWATLALLVPLMSWVCWNNWRLAK